MVSACSVPSVVQDCDVYLLDDILAAVDAHVAAWLTTHALTGPLLESKTRVVCSNASLLGLVADQSVRLYKGKVLSSDMAAKVGGGDEAVRGGLSLRGGRLEPSPLSIALGLAGMVQRCAMHISMCSLGWCPAVCVAASCSRNTVTVQTLSACARHFTCYKTRSTTADAHM